MSGGKFVLLIGASQFGEGGPEALTASETDVSALRDALLDPNIGGFAPQNVKNAMNGGGDETESLIMWLCENRDPDDLLLLYSTGHGLCDQRTNDLYLALQGTKVARPQIASLSAGWVKREIGLSRSTRKLVILDCCHSGLFGAAGTLAKRGETKLVTSETFNPQGKGSWTLASSTADQVSLVDLATHRSVFTESLVEALTTGIAAPDKEDLSVTELANWLQEEVPERAKALGGYMQPELLGSQRSPLIIARNPQPRRPVPQDLIDALSSDDELLRRGAIAKLAVYASDPASLWHDEARALLEKRLLPDGESHYELRGQIETALAPQPAVASAMPETNEEKAPPAIRAKSQKRQPRSKFFRPLDMIIAAVVAVFAIGAFVYDSQGRRVGVVKAEYEQRIAELQSVRTSLATLSGEKESLEAWTEELKDAVAYAERASDEQRKEIATLSEKYTALETELATARSSLEDTRHTLAQARARLQPVVEKNKELEKQLAALQAEKGQSERYADLSVFRDDLGNGIAGPEMVVIPAGRFTMGSPETEESRDDDEGPQREVSIGRFAMSRMEVTFDDWQACVEGGGCKSNPKPNDRGWGRGSRPVMYVNWNDVQKYIAWLNGRVDGSPYRLPTEAEWEYAARAGTTTPFWTGETISTDQANYNGNFVYESGREGVYREKTLPVGILNAPNPFGLHDVHGNVWEWVQDCPATDYSSAPLDGTAHSSSGCSQRVLRGGAWLNAPWVLRSAHRSVSDSDGRSYGVGFRLARTLTP